MVVDGPIPLITAITSLSGVNDPCSILQALCTYAFCYPFPFLLRVTLGSKALVASQWFTNPDIKKCILGVVPEYLAFDVEYVYYILLF